MVERGRGAGQRVSHCFVNEAVTWRAFELVVGSLGSSRVRDGVVCQCRGVERSHPFLSPLTWYTTDVVQLADVAMGPDNDRVMETMVQWSCRAGSFEAGELKEEEKA